MTSFFRLVSLLLGSVVLCASLASAQTVTFNSPLIDAANRGDEASVLLMLGQGQPVDGQGEYGVTPLMRAAYNGHLRIVKVLLGMGADVNATDIAGATALHLATRQGKEDVVDELLRAHANVNAVDQEGWTPLMRATLAKQPTIMRKLLDNGADPFKINSAGEYTLMYAVQTGNKEVVNVLVEKGVVTKDNPAVAPILGTEVVTSASVPTPEVQAKPLADVSQPSAPNAQINTAPVNAAAVSDVPAFAAFEKVKSFEEVTAEEAAAKEKKQKELELQQAKTAIVPEQKALEKAPVAVVSNKRIYRLQAGIYETQIEAKNAWKVFADTYPKIFAEQDNAVMQLPGGQTNSYTLVFGEFSNKQAADRLCSNLWQKDIGCFVMETSLTLAQLETNGTEPVKVAEQQVAKPAPAPASFDVAKALHEETVQTEIAVQNPALAPLPVGAELVDGLPWMNTPQEAEAVTLPKASDIDTKKVLASGETTSIRREKSILPQQKPEVPSKPAPIEKAAVIPAPKVEVEPVKKGKVEVAEAIRVQPGQKIVVPDMSDMPPVVDNATQTPPSAPVSPPEKLNVLPSVEVTGVVDSFWVQVGNFPSQQKALDFAKVIRQNQNFRGTRLRVVRLPAEAARHEPDIAVQLGKFATESKAKTLCKGDLSYLRCTVIRESGTES